MSKEDKVVGLIIYIAAAWFLIGLVVGFMSAPAHAVTQMSTSYGYEKPVSVTHVQKKKKKGKKAYRVSRGSPNCKINPQLTRKLGEIAAKFGPLKIISACRPGAVTRGGRPSLHRNGNAVDFTHPLKGQVVSYLRQTWHGGVMTYKKKRHIHIDTFAVADLSFEIIIVDVEARQQDQFLRQLLTATAAEKSHTLPL
jgi:hypothetical protein